MVATGGTAIACAELLTENFNIQKSDILILCIIDLKNLGGSKLEEKYNLRLWYHANTLRKEFF